MSITLLNKKCASNNALLRYNGLNQPLTITELTTLVIKDNLPLFGIEVFFSGMFPNNSYAKYVYVCGGDHIHVYGLHMQHVPISGQKTYGRCTVYGGDFVHININNKEVIV